MTRLRASAVTVAGMLAPVLILVVELGRRWQI